jgi:hypothetical protein
MCRVRYPRDGAYEFRISGRDGSSAFAAIEVSKWGRDGEKVMSNKWHDIDSGGEGITINDFGTQGNAVQLRIGSRPDLINADYHSEGIVAADDAEPNVSFLRTCKNVKKLVEIVASDSGSGVRRIQVERKDGELIEYVEPMELSFLSGEVRAFAEDSAGNRSALESFDLLPKLEVEVVDDWVIVSWPAICWPVVLESNEQLDQPLLWKAFDGVSEESGGRTVYRMSRSKNTRALFFRLRVLD